MKENSAEFVPFNTTRLEFFETHLGDFLAGNDNNATHQLLWGMVRAETQSPKAAEVHLKKAASLGSREALYFLGELTEEDLTGVEMLHLGLLYSKGIDLVQNRTKAEYWFTKIANDASSFNPQALTELGLIEARAAKESFYMMESYKAYRASLGLLPDPQKISEFEQEIITRNLRTVGFYEKALAAGDNTAQTYLGIIYSTEDMLGVPQNCTKAEELLKDDANYGCVYSQAILDKIAVSGCAAEDINIDTAGNIDTVFI